MTETGMSERWETLFHPDGPPSGGAGGTGGTDARMSLASSSDEQGGGGGSKGRLKASSGPWTTASGVAKALAASTQGGIAKLDTAHESVAAGAEGFASAPAMKTLHSQWKGRLEAVRKECERLDPALRRVGVALHETDLEAKSSFASKSGADAKAHQEPQSKISDYSQPPAWAGDAKSGG
ncbi:hypothetical protein [Streptomyces sp. H27-D2]|uniref:hypothetical protein n=1 Tax=Streptomyces sp. H27-D2 TaxID=3046304 RepID=UPI002DB88CCD|nr:hypothetical protein [Streptomyces sp. H27-D2]MEC4017136.1 hypothetical protein [Streptomyces sp. H27-D2]